MKINLSDLSLLTSIALHESELHGLVVASIIAKPRSSKMHWADLVESFRPGLCEREHLEAFCEMTYEQLTSAELEYQLLINADEAIAYRVLALGHWIRSFQTVFEAFNLWEQCCDPNERDELKHDFAEIALLDDTVDVEADDHHEEALLQLVEFLRITTLGMFDFSERHKDTE